MADTTTVPRALPETSDDALAIAPRRRLPGGRAVVGAFLVVLATVGTFGAYLQATAAPSTSFVVATDAIAVGTVLTESDVVTSFTEVGIDLPEEQAARTVRASQREALIGTVVVAPVGPGDLLLRSAVQPVGTAATGVQLSFAVPPDRAVGGDVNVGERVDVIGTFRDDRGRTTTSVVARQVVVVATPSSADGIGGGRLTLTVQVPDLATAQSVQHAVDVADVAILRGASPTSPDPSPVTAVGSTASGAETSDGGAP